MTKFTKEENQLLLTDLSARVPYGVKANIPLIDGDKRIYTVSFSEMDDFKKGYITIIPYLRPMSSMTEDEAIEFIKLTDNIIKYVNRYYAVLSIQQIDWLNAHHFDFRNLIERGLAISTEEYNPYKS